MNPQSVGTLLFGIVLSIASSVVAQTLTADKSEKRDALGDRMPLIMIHGFCGERSTWDHPDGFTQFFYKAKLDDEFKLYYFTYSTGSNVPAVILFSPCSANKNGDHTPSRIQGLAVSLNQALRGTPSIGPDKPIAIVAHSFGGLIARSFMQELRAYQRTLLLVTLGTPHHGTVVANDADFIARQLTGLYWDNYDGAFEPQNDWLRCLNGLPVDNPLVCLGEDLEARSGTFQKIVAIGVARRFSAIEDYPDDHLVPIQSALFLDSTSPVRRRYSGAWERSAGDCSGHRWAHTAIHYEDCHVADYPLFGTVEGVFEVIERELLASIPSSTVAFTGLGVDFFVNALSSDGSTIVGNSHTSPGHAVRWTKSGGLEILAEFLGATSSAAWGASADGSVIVGNVTHPDYEAVRWTGLTGIQGLGYLGSVNPQSLAFGVSADGSVVVGRSSEAFRWTAAAGMQGLGFGGYDPDVSADGLVVVGGNFRWSQADGLIDLGQLPGGSSSTFAKKVSVDGSVVAGDTFVGFERVAFRWTKGSGMVNLGNLAGASAAEVWGMSANGSLIVGLDGAEWFIWDSINGIRKLQDVLLNEHGIDLKGWTPNYSPGISISADGRTIVGSGTNPNGQSEVWMVSNFTPN